MKNKARRLLSSQKNHEVCQTCGSSSNSVKFVPCAQCHVAVVHQYCIDGPYKCDDEHITWSCEECECKIIEHSPPPTLRKSERLSSMVDREFMRKKARKMWRSKSSVLEIEQSNCATTNLNHFELVSSTNKNERGLHSSHKNGEHEQVKVKNNINSYIAFKACHTKEETLDMRRRRNQCGDVKSDSRLVESCSKLKHEEQLRNIGSNRDCKTDHLSSLNENKPSHENKGVKHMLANRKRRRMVLEMDSDEEGGSILAMKKERKPSDNLLVSNLDSKVKGNISENKGVKSDSRLVESCSKFKHEEELRNGGSNRDCKTDHLSSLNEKKPSYENKGVKRTLANRKRRRMVLEMDSDEESGSILATKKERKPSDNLLVSNLDNKVKGNISENKGVKDRSTNRKRRRVICQMDSDDENDSTSTMKVGPYSGSRSRSYDEIDDISGEVSKSDTVVGDDLLSVLCTLAPIESYGHVPTQPLPMNFDNIVPRQTIVAPPHKHVSAQPIIDAFWRGCCCMKSSAHHVSIGLEGHLSNVVDPKVFGAASALPSLIDFEVVSKKDAWPRAFTKSSPRSGDIGLYFFPIEERDEIQYDKMLEHMADHHLVLLSRINNVELLVFSSKELPQEEWRFRRKYYMWGVFQPSQGSFTTKKADNTHISKIDINNMGRNMMIRSLNGHISYKVESHPIDFSPHIFFKKFKSAYNDQRCDNVVV